MRLTNYLKTSSKQFPDKTAVVYNNQRVSYSELGRLSDILATQLIEKGITKGDRVALHLENSADYVISFFGILKAAAVVVPLNTQLVNRELAYLIEDCTPSFVITDSTQQSAFNGIIDPASVLTPALQHSCTPALKTGALETGALGH